MIRLCEECGREFEISKFQPYIKHCPEHRSRGKFQKKVRRDRSLAKSCCAESMRRAEERGKTGLVICSCKEQFWQIVIGTFRSFHRKEDDQFTVYCQGRMIGHASAPKQAIEMATEFYARRPV